MCKRQNSNDIDYTLTYYLLYSELIEGIDVLDENGEVIGQSKAAARSAITQVVLSRVLMATPGMGM